MIKDPHIWASPNWASFTAATDSNFMDASSNTVNALAEVVSENSSTSNRGWYINYTGPEKSFSKAILYDYSIFFTTYSAKIDESAQTNSDPCAPKATTGTAKIYGLNLLTANGAVNWNNTNADNAGNNPLDIHDRSKELKMQGIPPSPQLIFPAVTDSTDKSKKVTKILLFADLKKEHEWSDRFIPLYWEEVIDE
jgi:hypothetical protein